MSEVNPVLETHTEPDPTQISKPPQTYTYYHAGPLFSLGDLTANVHLSTAVHKHSNGKYHPILPQDLEQRDTSPHSIRDDDIKALLSCDLALFTYDGTELDSGTVIEYMIAKFADIPAVILRTDFRGGGDQASHQGDPWNLMSSFWPRSVGVVVNGMAEYKAGLAQGLSRYPKKAMAGSAVDVGLTGKLATEIFLTSTATKIVEGFDKVLRLPARMPQELRTSVYYWLALMPGFKEDHDDHHIEQMLDLLKSKEQKDLFDTDTSPGR